MLNKSFNKNILKIIDKLSYPMYIVCLDKRYKCPCLSQHENADKNCTKCLGTGYKIKIKKIEGVMEPDEVSVRLSGSQQKMAVNNYYFNAKKVDGSLIKPDNLIVREDEVDIVQDPKKYRSDSNNVIYYYVEGVKLRSYKNTFLKNFYNLIGGKNL